ncbi:polynucleotide adenylyltransferase, partial [Arcobacter sp. 31_11_sub10_T18]
MCIYTKKKKSTNIITLPKILTEILENLIGAGLKPVLVGGCIRDFYLDITCKDYDIEVYGIDDLVDLELNLEKFGTVVLAGKSFGVLKLSCEGYEFDFALPRTEIKTGSGHQGFEVQTNGQLDFKEAARRRDFTINAMGYDYTSKTLLDPYNGKEDIKRKVLRHIDDTTFVEDPLRVYRAVQFAARFEFSLDKRTFILCQGIVSKKQLEELAKERVFEEIKKLLLKAKQPSLGFILIKDLGILKYFPQLEVLIGCEQEKEYHPEGDVWIHTLMCLDEMAKLRSTDEYRNLYLMLAVLCHDLGKPVTSAVVNGKITSYNHEKEGLEPTIEFIQLLSNEK